MGCDRHCYYGKLGNGVKLPSKGTNFVTYSSLGSILGMTYVHSKVCDVVINAYKSLKGKHPEKIFMYGETGLKKGTNCV